MSNRFYLKNIGIALLALSSGFSPGTAHAGFQWVAPSAPPAASTPMAEAPAPEPETITPVVTGTPQPLLPIENTVQAPAEAAPLVPSSAVVAPAPAAVQVTMPAPTSAESVLSSPQLQESPASSPVVIQGTGAPAVKSDLPAPVLIQGSNDASQAISAAPPGEGGAVPVAGGELTPFSDHASVTLSPSAAAPVASTVQMPAGAVADTASPVIVASAPSAPTPSLAVESPSASTTVTLSSTAMPAETKQVEPVVIEPQTSVLQPASAPVPTLTPSLPPAPTVKSGVVHGFANHVPLAVALRQILPAGYGFSVDPNVDLGVLVSFQGGKSWRDTLDEALAPAGLVVREQGQMMEISYPAGKGPRDSVVSSDAAPVATLSSDLHQAMPAHNSMIDSPSAALPSVQAWDAEPGDSLHKVLEDWSHRANVEFDWMAEYDYPLQASVHLKGSFEEAVRGLLVGFEAAHPQPIAELHANAKVGQMVLVVTTRGNSTD